MTTVPDAAKTLLADLATRLGVPPLPFDGQGVALLPVDDMTQVLFMVDDSLPGFMDVMSAVGPVPEDARRLPFLRRLLGANLFGSATSGATLSVDAQTEAVVVHRRVALAHCDVDGLAAVVEGLLNEVERWRTEILAPAA